MDLAIPLADLLKTTEAAVVSSVEVREVNRVIDERILPDDFLPPRRGRHVLAAGCGLISFYVEAAGRLTAEERLFAIRATGPRLYRSRDLALADLLAEDWTVRDGFLSIDLAPFVTGAKARMDRLAAARAVVESSADILGGVPVFKGTRIPVHDVAASVAKGLAAESIAMAYPGLDREQVDLGVIYAAANPTRGRPRNRGARPEGTVLLADRAVARRRLAG